MRFVANTTAKVLVEDIREHVRPVYPDAYNWEETIKFLLDDPIEKAIVDKLIEALREDGCFQNPIRIEDGSGYEFDDGYQGMVLGNGTHRAVAAMVYGAQEIDARFNKTESSESDEIDNEPIIVVEIEADFDEDQLMDIFSALRSFSVNDKWIEADGSSSNRRVYELVYAGVESIREDEVILGCSAQLERWLPEMSFSIKATKTTSKEHWGS